MDAKQFLVLGASMLAASLSGPAAAQEAREPYVRGRKSRSIRHRSSPNVDAYKSHLETAHFKKYKTTTQLDFGQKFNGLAMVRKAKYGACQFL
jgi:hypothetical protein